MDNKLKIHEIEGRKMVHSMEYYKATGHRVFNYTRWMVVNVLNNAQPGRDYIPAPENTVGRTIRFRLRYFLDIDFAISLCLVIKRKEAIAIREFLLDAKGERKEPNNDLKPDLTNSNVHSRNFPKKITE